MFQYLTIMLQAQKSKMDERGASAVEYGLLVAGIAAVIIIVVMTLGGKINDAFGTTCSNISGGSGSCD